MDVSKFKPLIAELLGSLLLTGVVIGSGILGADLSNGNQAIALIGNTIATGAILWILVAVLAPISGAHFNPAVTIAFLITKQISRRLAFVYIVFQIFGCIIGAWLAHVMFELPLFQIGTNDRSGISKIIAEAVATFTLVFAIFGAIKHDPKSVPMAVALAIVAGYWWTSSTSFANPAITVARSLTDSFAGISPTNLPGFIIGQLIGAFLATFISSFLFAKRNTSLS